MAETVRVEIEGAAPVSGLLQMPADARACYVFAHGAGAGMAHPFMAAVADQLERRKIATLRFQFPYMARGSKRPDAPRIAHAAIRAAGEAACACEVMRPPNDLPPGHSFQVRAETIEAIVARIDSVIR